MVFKPLRIDQLLFDVHQTINRIHPDNKVHIDLSLLPDNPEKLSVNGNEQLLHLALSNIILNAYKYSNNQRVIVSLGISDSQVILFVKDTGIGIPPHAREYVFDEFRQVDQTSKRKYGGTGLGLAIVQKYARAMDGSVALQSEMGQGSTFRVSLPLKLEAQR